MFKNIFLMLMLTIYFSPRSEAQEKQKIPSPDDITVTRLVLSDLLQVPQHKRPFVRYLVAPPNPSPDWIHVANYLINSTMSRVRNFRYGEIVANGYILRYDLSLLSNNENELKRLIELWDYLAFRDPYYHLNLQLTEKTISNIARQTNSAVIAPHIENIVADLAVQENFSPSIAYRFDFFLHQTFQAANTNLGRGLYYEFLQFKSRKGKEFYWQDGVRYRRDTQRSDLDLYLETKGIDPDVVDETIGERRIAIFFSLVTGKVRVVTTFIGNGGLRVWITEDIAIGSIDVTQHVFYSLLSFEDDAKELIGEKENGLHEYALYDGDGVLQDFAPQSIAIDNTIPHPFTNFLTPGISCVRCHSVGMEGGLKPTENDVPTILENATLFDEITANNPQEAFDIIETLYSGNKFQLLLERGRIDHDADACLRLIGNPNIPPDVSPFGLIAREMEKIWFNYEYTLIDARIAYLELTGVDLLQISDPKEELKKLLDPGVGPTIEDPTVIQLINGGKITRIDWERIYTLCALRMVRNKQREKASEILNKSKKQ